MIIGAYPRSLSTSSASLVLQLEGRVAAVQQGCTHSFKEVKGLQPHKVSEDPTITSLLNKEPHFKARDTSMV